MNRILRLPLDPIHSADGGSHGQDVDCQTSEWAEWTACSHLVHTVVSCSFFGVETVVTQAAIALECAVAPAIFPNSHLEVVGGSALAICVLQFSLISFSTCKVLLALMRL